MKKLRHLIAAITGSAALVMTAVPASATPFAFVVTGTATVGSPGLTTPVCAIPGPLPAACPATTVSWTIDAGTTASGYHDGVVAGAAVTGSGTVTGWCGQSTGSGTVTVAGITANITWTSAGGTIILTGSGGGHTVVATVQARPTGGNCVTARANNFLIAGSATGA